MKRYGLFVVILILVCTAILSGCMPLLGPARQLSAEITSHPSQGDVTEIVAAQARLVTSEAGATMNFNTAELEPDHVYTAWWVVVNNPDACATSPCSAADVLGKSAEVKSEAGYADGILTGEDGTGNFFAHLPLGLLPDGWFGNGFTNPRGAEIHIVINDHGPAIPDLLDNMLNSYRGGCTDESLPPPFPDTAKADGTPGPNACRLFQVAIFQQ